MVLAEECSLVFKMSSARANDAFYRKDTEPFLMWEVLVDCLFLTILDLNFSLQCNIYILVVVVVVYSC